MAADKLMVHNGEAVYQQQIGDRTETATALHKSLTKVTMSKIWSNHSEVELRQPCLIFLW